MNEAVDPVLDPDEDAEVCDVADHALDARSRWVPFLQQAPGVGLHLLHPEGDLAALLVHIKIRGFGSFQVKIREAREGRNPKTGEEVKIPAKRTPFFKVGKELKERIDATGRAKREAAAIMDEQSGAGSAENV